MVIGVLDSKEELKESENDAPKLETPLREEPRLAPQTLPEASEVLENKREESKVEITEPAQADDIRKVVGELAKDISITKLYMTGHSLGCYLAQIAEVEAYQKYPDFYNHVLRKVTTFSAPKVITSRTVWNAKNGFWDVGLESRKLAVSGKLSIMWLIMTML